MLKVGITGGIGSGKSTVSQLFELLGVPVYNADDAARKLMNENPAIRQELQALLGDNAYTSTGLNRKWIAERVFADAELLAKVNAIVHPRVIQHGIDWMNSRTEPIIMKEAAIFFETGSAAGMDQIIGVYAPVPLRMLRAMNRDQISREEVQERMDRQIDETLKMKLCDFVIINNEVEMLIPQVLALHKQLSQMANHSKASATG